MGERTVKSNFVIATILAVMIGSAAYFAGCSDSKPREASHKVLAAVSEAQRYYDAASAILSNAVAVKAGTNEPLIADGAVLDKDQIEVKSLLTVNEQAGQRLQKAEELLTAALSENSQADESIKAQAQDMLGRVQAMQGYFFASKAASARHDVAAALVGGEEALAGAAGENSVLAYFQKISSASDEDLKKARDEAARAEKQLADQIKTIENRLSELAATRQQLAAENDKRMVEARNLRTESGLASGQKSLDLFEQALKIEDTVTENGTKTAQIEAEKENLELQAKTLKIEAAAAKGQVGALVATLDSRQARTQAAARKRDEVAQRLAESQKKIETAAGKIAAGLKSVSENEAKAVECYTQAAASLKNAQNDAAFAATAAAGAGDALVAIADIDAQRLSLQQQASHFAGGVTAFYGQLKKDLPPMLKDLSGYVSDTKKLQEDAAAKYADAISLYKNSISREQPQQQWIYQGRLGAAYIGLSKVTNDAGALSQAAIVLDQAMQGREASPYLASVVELKRLTAKASSQPGKPE